jgi:WD40 repeat protein
MLNSNIKFFVASILLFFALPSSAQFKPLPLLTLHPFAKEEQNFSGKIKSYIAGALTAEFSPDGSLIVTTSSLSQAIKVYQVSSGKLLWEDEVGFTFLEQIKLDLSFREYLDRLEAPVQKAVGNYANLVTYVGFNADGTRILAASYRPVDKFASAVIFDAKNGDRQANLDITEPIHVAAFSPNGASLVTASSMKDRGPAKVWDALTSKLVTELDGGRIHNVSSIAYSHDGTRFYTVNEVDNRNFVLNQWNAEDNARLQSVQLAIFSRAKFSLSPDGKHIVVSEPSSNLKVKVFDTAIPNLASNSELFTITHDQTRFFGPKLIEAVYAPNGKSILTASNDGIAKIWDAATGALMHTLQAGESLKSAVFSPDSTRILTHTNNYARVFDAETGHLIFDFSDLDNLKDSFKSSFATFNNDGTQVLTTYGQTATVWLLPPRVFTDDRALAEAKNSLMLRALKTMILSYLTYLMPGSEPSLEKFILKYPQAKRLTMVNLLKDMIYSNKDVGPYLQALFPELKQ